MQKMVIMLLAFILGAPSVACAEVADASDRAYIEQALDLSRNGLQEWAYAPDADAWVMSVVSAVAYPELPDQQGVSVAVPGAYVIGIDTDGDSLADVTNDTASAAVQGALVIDSDAQVVSRHGQVYTAATAPVILATGAAGYGSQRNSTASTQYAIDGYIAVACGNRGKQDTVTGDDGTVRFTGDAPSCLVDQKAAARFVKYNILLGNLPGSVDHFVSTGGSGGGAHAAMFAATSNHPDFYDYQIEVGAVGVYRAADGTHSTTVTIDGVDHSISDGAWGTIAYSPITPLAEADMAMAFESYMDTTYDYATPFQAQLAQYLSAAYMEYINAQHLSVQEADVGFDLNEDGDMDDEVALTIECDREQFPETNGYYGTYLNLYLAEFRENLQWTLDNLAYAEDWTWFGADGAALSDEAVAGMTASDKAAAFIEGRYAKGAGEKRGGMGGRGGMDGNRPDGAMPGGMGGNRPNGMPGRDMLVGTPDGGTTQSATGQVDSVNYASYDEMVASYEADIGQIAAGDRYGNDIVSLYNPLNYIGAEGTENPAWALMMMGAIEGDMAMMNSMNMKLAWRSAGVDADIAWQWDGGHVPSEVLGDSFSLTVDRMYGVHVQGAAPVEKAAPTPQTKNGTATSASGKDLSAWVDASDPQRISFALKDVLAYRNSGASKATPGFDVIDYGQEDYVFGSATADARHWNPYLLTIFTAHAETLAPLFNQPG